MQIIWIQKSKDNFVPHMIHMILMGVAVYSFKDVKMSFDFSEALIGTFNVSLLA